MNSRHFFFGAFGRITSHPSFLQQVGDIAKAATFSLQEKGFCVFAKEPTKGISLIPFSQNQGAIFGKIFEKNSAKEIVEGSLIISKTAVDFENFWGKYVGVFFDKKKHSLHLFRDPLGFSTLFYKVTEEGVVFSNQLHLLYDFLEAKPELNWNYFAEKLFDRNHCLSITPFQGIQELLPGLEISFDQQSQKKERFFWNIDNLRGEFIVNKKAFEEELLDILKISVQAWGNEHDAIALELSGGTDSSGVLILLKHLFPQKEVFPLHYFDSAKVNASERHFAEMVANSCGYPLHIIDYAGDSWIDETPMPWRVNNTRGSLYTYKRWDCLQSFMTNNKCTLLMNGQGGDHVFLSPPPPVSLKDVLQNRRFGSFFSVMSELSSLYRMPWWTFLNEFKTKKNPQAHLPFTSYFQPDWIQTFCREEFFLKQKLAPFPKGKASQIKAIFHGTAYSERDELPFSFSYSHPLLSQPLVEKALQIPTYQSFEDGFDRIFFRKAVSRLQLSDAVWRKRKSDTTASALKAFEKDMREIKKTLMTGTLAKSGIVYLPKVEKSLAQIRHGQTEEIWPILHLLECQRWLTQWDSYKLHEDNSVPQAHFQD